MSLAAIVKHERNIFTAFITAIVEKCAHEIANHHVVGADQVVEEAKVQYVLQKYLVL